MILARMVIPTDKFDETVSFYQNIFDFPFSVAKDEAIAKIDNFLVNIVKTDATSIFSPTGNGIYFSFLFSDLTSVKKRIPAPNFIKEWEEDNIQSVLARDPNNNLILLKQLASGSSESEQAFELSSIKVTFLSSYLRNFMYAIRNLIQALRKCGYRDDMIQKFVQIGLLLDEMFEKRKTHLSKVPQTLGEKKEFDQYYVQSSQSLKLVADDVEKILNVVSPTPELFGNVEVQKAIGISRDVIADSKDLLELGDRE